VAALAHVDLSHVITSGMVTYPGLPVPLVADHLSRDAAEEIYGAGITFQIGLVTMCTSAPRPRRRLRRDRLAQHRRH
jgi:hypothetical protein